MPRSNNRRRKSPRAAERRTPQQPEGPVTLRIIGGRLRGRRLEYHGDARTRPMKDRVREAVFNLVGPQIVGLHALDLFAGTGALGLEAISRGAAKATFFEHHFPTAELIRRNATSLGVSQGVQIFAADTFAWFRRIRVQSVPGQLLELLGPEPWLVFISPPFDFYQSRLNELLELIKQLLDGAPEGSVFALESPQEFDCQGLPRPGDWDVRLYPPAQVGLLRVPRGPARRSGFRA